MPATIRWLLNQNILGEFRLLAGAAGLDNRITSVNIMDNPDTINWLVSEELVLTTGYLFQADARLRARVIPELSNKGCAGIGFVLKRYFDELPEDMVRQANELGFPIFSVPYELSLGEVGWLVHQRNFEEKQTETERMAAIYKKLTEDTAKDHGVSQLLSDIVGVVECPVLLLESGFQLIDYEISDGGDKELFSFFQLQKGLPVFPAHIIETLRERFGRQKLVSVSHLLTNSHQGLKCILFPITESDAILGYICFCEVHKELNSVDYHFIRTVQPVLGIYLMRRMVHTRLRGSTKSDFIKILMSEDLIPDRELRAQCDLYRFEYRTWRICAVIRLIDYDGKSLTRRRELASRAYEATRSYLDSVHPASYRVMFESNILLFLYFPDGDTIEMSGQATALVHGILDHLHNLGIFTQAGLSKAYRGVDTIRRCLRQALEALCLGSELHPNQTLHSYLHDQLYHIMAAGLTSSQATELFEESWGRLNHYDNQNSQELARTMRVFLDNGLNTTDAATELFIHRNTMFRRLEKIREILGQDPRNLQVCLDLLIGARASELDKHGLLGQET